MNVRLLRTEWRRFWLRRVTRVALGLVLLAAAVVMTLGSWHTTERVSASERAAAAQQAQVDNSGWSESDRANCRRDAQQALPAGGSVPVGSCGDETADSVVRHQSTRAALLDQVPDAVTQLGVLTVLVVVASFIGAEFSSGSLGNQLTFEPRRGHTFWAKLLAAAMGSLTIGLLLSLVASGAVAAVSALHQAPAGVPAGGTAHWWWTMMRTIVAVGALGTGFAALGILLRHTAAVMGIAVGYLITVEILAVRFPRSQAVSLVTALQAVVHGRVGYTTESCALQKGGYACSQVEHSMWLGHGLAVLGVTVVTGTLLALVVFRRRDVN